MPDFARLRAKRLFLLGTPSMISEFEAAGFESAADSANGSSETIRSFSSGCG